MEMEIREMTGMGRVLSLLPATVVRSGARVVAAADGNPDGA